MTARTAKLLSFEIRYDTQRYTLFCQNQTKEIVDIEGASPCNYTIEINHFKAISRVYTINPLITNNQVFTKIGPLS